MLKWISLAGLCLSSLTAFAQLTQPPFTPALERIKSYDQRKALENNSIVNTVPFRSAGPSVQSGRVVDLDVSPDDPSHFYVAYASGGLWKTVNNGTSFIPLFDKEMVMTIGDIAVDWKRNIIWVGAGEVNSSRSSYSGTGLFRSDNGGKSWKHLGLGESHHIGRIILHPTDPNTLWVAVLGHLYSPNQERGVYKTTDGGKTWKRTLFVNDNTGAVDLVVDPSNPNVLYASMWERSRRAWDFVESGKGSGIHKSIDGGNTWTLLTATDKSGFPHGEGAGRIGLAITRDKGKTVLLAAIDNYFRRPKEAEEEQVLTKDKLRSISKEDFLKLEKYLIKEYLQSNGFPQKYTVDKVIDMVRKEEIKPLALVEYVEDANSLLFDTPVIGLEIYRSDNEGTTWQKTHKGYLEDVYNSYGYYFGQVRVAPNNPQKVYVYGVPVLRSEDGGKTFKNINGDNVHVDHHDLWINPKRPGHLILGNDGGINISYDDGEHWIKCNTPPVGQFYAVAVDMAKPYNIYGGLQDNGVWKGPANYEASTEWHGTGHYPFEELLGGDGMQVAVDTRDNETIYTGFQFGNYFRINKKSGEFKRISPKQDLGERPLRWNWQAPIHLSVHNQDILYMGSNKLHRSFNKGDEFSDISGDLTSGGRKGDVAYATLASIHESPMRFGLIYTGSDDGLVHVTRDGGFSWKNISSGLPELMWVSRVQASKFEEGRVYVSLNGYRWDNFDPMLYVSENYGETWTRIGSNLPLEPINVVREDPENPDLLYVGTDHGLYISLNRGKDFMRMHNEMPDVSVHDLVIHPREREALIGTHGRSLYIARVKELQQLRDTVLAKPVFAFEVDKMRAGRWGNNTSWFKSDPPQLDIPVYANAAGKAKLTLQTEKGLTLHEWETDCRKGLNYLSYDLTISGQNREEYNKWLNEKTKPGERQVNVKPAKDGKTYLAKGAYKVLIDLNGAKAETKVVLE
ncbi:MAG: glycosyl hydrolase [Saprospiraceae bacterium]|nr:glycosyl hydrolase [Saprospiraceae bacterium]